MPSTQFPPNRLPGEPLSVSTTRILGNFTKDPLPDVQDLELLKRRSSLQEHADTVEELRLWAKYRDSYSATKSFFRTIFMRDRRVDMPSEQSLYPVINHFFPPRSEIVVIICDFGEGKAQRKEVRLGDIEVEFRTKPDWSTVRWIHAPLGVGLLHSSVESLFFNSGSGITGRPFTNGGRAGWPFLEIEALDIRKSKDIRDARDVLRILEKEKQFTADLDRSVWIGDNNEKLKQDVIWRSQYVDQNPGFWELAEGDLPWQISDGSHLNMTGPTNRVRSKKLQMTAQSLARHPFYKDTCLVRNPFRTFHRDDGFLLTMSSNAGVDYLNKNVPHYLDKSREYLFRDPYASAIAQIFTEFSETGTDTWFRKNAEWFLMYLITEVTVTPHNIRQGFSVPSLMDAYDAVVHELKERRYDQWQRNETIKLVRSYLVCIDELAVLEEIFAKKVDFFRRLRVDIDELEMQDNAAGKLPDNPDVETPSTRISFSERAMEDSARQCKRLVADLRQSMNSLFQLRSIEQNELAIIADTQNKSLFVFTAVTIVFLPLSFFTSYYGMNLKGIIDTEHSVAYFWEVCGTVAVAIVLVVAMYAFRRRIMQSAWVDRVSAHSF